MNLLILQSAGEHAENVEFRECLCAQRALARVAPEVQVRVCGPGHAGEEPASGWADTVLILENYSRHPWVTDALARLAPHAFRVFWTIDCHVALARHVAEAKEWRAGLVLQATPRFVASFQWLGTRCEWFPNCYPSDLIRPAPDRERVADVGFCGSRLNRAPMLAQLREAFGERMHVDEGVLGAGMVAAINGYRIHWNHSYRGDLNYRLFETAGCATALLTDYVDCLWNVFLEGKEVSTYTTMGEAVEQAKWWLDHPMQREQAAWAAHTRASLTHTYDARMHTLLSLLRGIV